MSEPEETTQIGDKGLISEEAINQKYGVNSEAGNRATAVKPVIFEPPVDPDDTAEIPVQAVRPESPSRLGAPIPHSSK